MDSEGRNLVLICVGVVAAGCGLGLAISAFNSGPDKSSEPPVASVNPRPAWEATSVDYERETAQRVRRALLTIEKQRDRPQELSESACEPGSTCETQISLNDEGSAWLVARYRKSDTKAVRFTFYGQSAVGCSAIGAELELLVPERGMFARADICRFVAPPLKGWKALIEANRSPSGQLTPGIHIYSATYRAKDKSFRMSLEDYEQRAR